MTIKRLMLIDGNSLLYRAFYALPLLHTQEGVYTNGVYGFLTMYNRLVGEVDPTHIVVAFDLERKTFRNDTYSEYKATRSPAPQELQGQFQILREVLSALNVHYEEVLGYEADDIIGTLSKRAESEGFECIIVTGDQDALQLVSSQTRVYLTKKGISEIEIYDPDQVKLKWEVGPEKIVEIKALMGDPSDNIPGVPGVGVKTAIKLIKEFATLENLYEHLDQVKGQKLKEKLINNREQAFMSRELALIVLDVELSSVWEDYAVQVPKEEEIRSLYKSLEFNKFLSALPDTSKEERAIEEIKVRELINQAQTWEFCQSVKTGDNLALLVETNYHHPMWAKIKAIYLEWNQEVYRLNLEQEQQITWLKGLLENESIGKYMHNAKSAQVMLKRQGIELKGIKGDTLLLTYVLDPSFPKEDLASTLSYHLQIDAADSSPAFQVSRLREMYELLYRQAPPELRELLERIELPLSAILATMEHWGIKVEKSILDNIAADLAVRIGQDEEEIFRLAGSTFNINSPQQLGKVLFEDLGLPSGKKTKKGYSTSQEVLKRLLGCNDIIAYIMNYRHLTKLKSTYVDGLQGVIHPETGRVHTIFKQGITATGRLSSVEPNLQNIPIRMEEGHRIRKAFKGSSEEWSILSADYSQIDLRSLAHISGDETLIETFVQGIDIHTRTAAEIFNVPLKNVDADLRRQAKAVNFGIIYGISDFGLARNTGVSRQEAGRYIEEYLDSYPGVKKYMDEVVQSGIEKGYVETILKRRRYLPDLRSSNKMVQSFARRMALNTPIQGTSADIIKIAMIKVANELARTRMKARLLLQVHDELVLEVFNSELRQVAALVKECMENAYPLRVPLEVTLQAGSNWYDLQNLQ